MKKRLFTLLLALTLAFTPVFAEETQTNKFSPALQEDIIRHYAHLIAENYFYGVSDNNLLYAMLCATIENDGQFDLDLALKSMIDFLDDDYAEYYSPEVYESQSEYFSGSFYGIGVVLEPHDGGTAVQSVYSGGGADMAGIKTGDMIIAVDENDTSTFTPAQVRELVVGLDGTTVKITVKRGEEIINVYAVRGKVNESHSTMEILENNIAYIDVESFTGSLPDDFDGYIKALKEKGIYRVVIDLRDNGGGDLDAAIAVAQKLIPAGLIATIKTSKNGVDVEEVYSENLDAPNFNMLVLVNENTASASEFLAMALQSRGRAKLMGTNTFGKGCLQVMTRTPTGSGLKFTIGEYFSIKDERINTIGLTPDIEVNNTVTPVDWENFAKIDFENLDSAETKLGIEQRLGAVQLIPQSEVDGEFNDITKNAIKAFQRYAKLDETGEADFYTALQINDYEYEGLYIVTDVQMQEALKYFE